MDNFLKSIATSLVLYILLTIPHLICMFTWGKYGIDYGFEVMMLIGFISGILGPSISKKIF
jgi:preprotein translocase subunit SecF